MTVSARSVRTAQMSPDGNSRKGFASMDPVRQKLIASQGGKKAHLIGTAHQWTSEEAREAGRKGGRTTALVVAAAKQAAPVPSNEA